ncbi:MAG: DUF58 domain-containing protein [Gammaproteobacteria bacterium]|nr:DUF58 domain-containing protein [Gammaproteobacteria bacterium]
MSPCPFHNGVIDLAVSSSSSSRSFFRLPDFSRKPVFKFIAKRIGPFKGAVMLDRSRVYILPTKAGLIFLVLLLLLLIGSINYDKSLGYVLTFVLVGLGNVIMFSTWKNLAGLRLRAGGCLPVFAGDKAVFAVQLENPDAQDRYSIAASHHGQEFEVVDISGEGMSLVHFQVDAPQRGMLDAGRFRLQTEFPAGLFVAWTWIDLSMQCLVYPKPASRAELPVSASTEEGDHVMQGGGVEEYAGLRKYQPGDSWRRVAWKAMARSNELVVREYSGGQPQLQWIDWQALAMSGTESRLSAMTRLVIDAQEAGRHYGLRLPSLEIEPAHGRAHYTRCLKVLALYGR